MSDAFLVLLSVVVIVFGLGGLSTLARVSSLEARVSALESAAIARAEKGSD